MTDFKKSKANNTTETKNVKDIASKTGNLYEAVAVMSKRAVQINKDIKEELLSKLAEFATPSESIEEIFENSEQIEVSKFYEKLPKGTLIAVQEFLEDNIYHRNAKLDNEEESAA
jgi:DNA-directed RNA polymerase subunit K/omega